MTLRPFDKLSAQDDPSTGLRRERSVERSGQARPKKETKTDYTNESQQNLMRIVEYLATDVFKPTTVQELVDALEGLSYSKASWTLQNLKQRDWAEQIGDTWRLSPRIVRIADSVRANLGETMKRYVG